MAEDSKKEENIETPEVMVDDTLSKVSEKINDAESILVALSKDPSVDEMSAAIGLTLALDKMGKHAIAIYSGKTPNALEFLKPEDTFEPNTNSLQDFIIALDKEKADHLRYKIEGDFVKVYITPYKTTISEDDLEFSHGEVNVDLIISFNVEEIEDLDAALQQHGRIMHDAGSINISNGAPGRLGGVEWNKPEASSVSEMTAELLEYMEQQLNKDVATALLTGIVAATERFSNEKTTPGTMTIASNLMKDGADQQLIISNINKKGEKEAPKEEKEEELEKEADSIEVEHGKEEKSEDENKSAEAQLEEMLTGGAKSGVEKPGGQQQVMDELKALAEQVPKVESAPVEMPAESMTVRGMEVPKVEEKKEEVPEFQPLSSDTISEFAPRGGQVIEPEKNAEVVSVATASVPAAAVYGVNTDRTDLHAGKMETSDEVEKPKDYSKMMEEALAEATPAVEQPVAGQVIASQPVVTNQVVANPAVAAAPAVSAVPAQEQSLDDMVNQMVSKAQAESAQSGGVTLPQPPAPAVGGSMMPPTGQIGPGLPPVQVPEPPVPEMSQPMGAVNMTTNAASVMPSANPAVNAAPNVVAQPQDDSAVVGVPEAPEGVVAPPEPVNPVIVQPVSDPGAFKIPGM